MYTLRKVIDNIQSNQEIGNDYQVVERFLNYDEFCKAFERTHVADLDGTSDNYTKNCYAILTVNGGSSFIPLYMNQQNYIMSDSGKTFSNLTFK
jgi:hypothetical protein